MANPILCMIARPFKSRANAKKLNNNNEINEKRFVDINGIEQYITIRGTKKENPVMLFIHGGPAASYTPFNVWLLPWEKHFTIVQWDQIGCGKTYKKNGKVENLTFDRLATDGITLAKYLCEYLDKEKIVLIGSSAGSLVALKMIKQESRLFYAYVGADQNSPSSSNIDKTNWTKDQVLAESKQALKANKKAPHMIYDLMLPALMYDKDYTMKDLRTMSKGMDWALEKLHKEMVNFHFDKVGYKFEIPFFIFQGEYDEVTPIKDAQSYFNKIIAPYKEFVPIKNAGHLCEFANPEQFLDELRNKVLSSIELK